MNKTLASLAIGSLSGTVLCMIFVMFFRNEDLGILIPVMVMLGGGIATGYGVLKTSETVAKMWVMGSIIGAIEWLLLAVIITDVSLRMAMQNPATSAVELTSVEQTLTTAGIFSLGGTGITVFMTVFCLIISVIAQKANKEFQPEPA